MSAKQDVKQPLSMDDQDKERETVRSTNEQMEKEDDDEIKGNLLG